MIYEVNGELRGEQVEALKKSVGYDVVMNTYDDVLKNAYFYIACKEKEQMIGFLHVISNGVSNAYIQDVIVATNYQRKGIGTMLVKQALTKLEDEHIPMISIAFDEASKDFYKKLGFKIQMSGFMKSESFEIVKEGPLRKLKGVNFDITPTSCPWKDSKKKCAVKNSSLCPSFGGLKGSYIQCCYPDKSHKKRQFLCKIGHRDWALRKSKEIRVKKANIDMICDQQISYYQEHCPWNKDMHTTFHTCRNNDHRCPYFKGIEYMDTALCTYQKEECEMKRKTVLYIAMSVDGYIADEQGGVDWLQKEGSTYDGYEAFLSNVDTIVMGRVTYDQIVRELATDEWPYPNKKCYVASKNTLGKNEHVAFVNYDVCGFIDYLKDTKGKDIWILGGAKLIDDCIKANVIDEYHIAIIPTILGKGIKLFPSDANMIDLKLISSQSFGDMMMVKYTKAI